MHTLSVIEPGMTFEQTKSALEALGLVVIEYPEDDLYLVKYVKSQSNMENLDVVKCRGMILRRSDNQLVCFPPMKSSFIPPEELSKLDFNQLSFEDFVDGTMINVFYHNGKWMIATRSYLNATCKFYSHRTFADLFNEALDFNLSDLDKNNCYSFVLQHPENRIVTKYEKPSVTLVCARNINGLSVNNLNIYQIQIELMESGVNINTPAKFNMINIETIFSYMANLNYQKQGIVIKMEYNGYPVRFKVRNMSYNYVKNMRGNNKNIKFLFYNLRKSGSIKEYLQYFPEYDKGFNYYQTEIHQVTKKLFKYYHNCYVKKSESKDNIPYEFKPLCYELHGHYLKFRNYIDFECTKRYINNLPCERLLFVVNYKYREEPESEVTDQLTNQMDLMEV